MSFRIIEGDFPKVGFRSSGNSLCLDAPIHEFGEHQFEYSNIAWVSVIDYHDTSSPVSTPKKGFLLDPIGVSWDYLRGVAGANKTQLKSVTFQIFFKDGKTLIAHSSIEEFDELVSLMTSYMEKRIYS